MELELAECPGFVWTVAHVKSRCEKQVAEFAERHGIMHYLPLLRKVKRFQRRNVETRVPMFNGYVFVRLGAGDRERLAECHRVVRFFQMTPEREARLLEDLRGVRQLELTSAVSEVVVSPELAPGRLVVVRSGPFRGVRGVVVRRRDSIRVTVNVEMLGQSVSAEVDVGELEPEE